MAGLKPFGLPGVKKSARRRALSSGSILLVILLAGLLVVSGCAPGIQGRGLARGWSGIAVADGVLYVGSMEGELVSASVSTHNPLWPGVSLGTVERSGGFGCAPGSNAVATYGTPAVSGDLVYVAGYDGRVHAVNAELGRVEWQYPPQDEFGLKAIAGGVAVARGKIFFGTSSCRVYALNESSHAEAWAEPFETGDKIWSTPVVDGNTLYIGSFDNKLYALNVADGTKKWDFATEGVIIATPVVYNNTIYFGSFDRHVYAVNTDGSLKWKSEVQDDNWFWASVVAHDNTIYAPSMDGKVYVLDAATGTEVIEALVLDSAVPSSPVMVGDALIIASEKGQMYRLDTETNEKTTLDVPWEKEEIRAPLAASEGVVFVHTQEDETVYALNAENGARQWKLTLSSE